MKLGISIQNRKEENIKQIEMNCKNKINYQNRSEELECKLKLDIMKIAEL